MNAMGDFKSGDNENANSKLEFLIFMLGGECYAIQLLWILEIKSLENLKISSKLEEFFADHRHCNKTPYLKGIAEIHDLIVPIIDLRVLYNSAQPVADKSSVVIIVTVDGNCLGMVVDEVADLVSLRAAQIKDPPEYYAQNYIKGIAAEADNLFLILDVERLIKSSKLGIVHDVGK